MPKTSIRTINTLHDGLSAIHYDSWVIFDLDNTTITSSIELGGEAWFSHCFSMLNAEAASFTQEMALLLIVYNAMQHHVQLNPVESSTVRLIQSLQAIGMPVFALTARGYEIGPDTYTQLKNVGIDFSANSPFVDDEGLISNGIIYCAGKAKGETLLRVLKKHPVHPKGMIMFDDKKSHLLDLEDVLDSLAINFQGLHYNYLASAIKRFDFVKATHQLMYLWPYLNADVKQAALELHLLTKPIERPQTPKDYAKYFYNLKPISPEPIHDKEVVQAHGKIEGHVTPIKGLNI